MAIDAAELRKVKNGSRKDLAVCSRNNKVRLIRRKLCECFFISECIRLINFNIVLLGHNLYRRSRKDMLTSYGLIRLA